MKWFLLLFLFSSLPALAQKRVAVVRQLRGQVELLTMEKTLPLEIDHWVDSGAMVKTAENSFVKLIFTDESQMIIGPNSEMKIEELGAKTSGVFALEGKVRLLKQKSKLFIKTPNAIIRATGADFLISTNGIATSTIVFEGELVFNKLINPESGSIDKLEQILDQGVRIFPGEFSVVEQERSSPTVPSLLNVEQKTNLEKAETFERDPDPLSRERDEVTSSIVPAGLDGQVVSNDSSTLQSELPAPEAPEQAATSAERSSADPVGYLLGEKVKPTNGSFLHVDSGVIIPPGPGSVLDNNTNTFIPVSSGRVTLEGNYVPPKNMEITSQGKILLTASDSNGNIKVIESSKPVPVISRIPVLSPLASAAFVMTSTTPTKRIISNDLIDSATSSSELQNDLGTISTGGLSSVDDAAQTGGNLPVER